MVLNQIDTASPRFLASKEHLSSAVVALLGVPLDVTVSYRPGTRRGPEAIRRSSWNLEEFSFYQECDLSAAPFTDLGDLALPSGSVGRSLEVITSAVQELIRADKIPFLLGGEHLLTLAAVRALAEHHPDLVVLQLDAHADLRPDYEGEELSHATVMRQIANFLPPKQIYQFGIRSGTAAELEFGRENTRFFPFKVEESLRRVRPELVGKPLYLTLDIDVFDPAYAPGVGTPEPGGQSAHEVLAALSLLRGLNLVGLDIVEVCPPFDPSESTAALAALLVRELLLLWAHR
ncbi:MAG: agmatinase [Firmicutes bacterium]|jgi:agmatinase|nr:agmatinase [Bacillota bacterium]